MKFQIMDQTGHTTMEFLSDDAGVKNAMEKFEQLVAEGKTAAARKNGESDYTVTRKFDATADEVLFQPQLVGG